mmetsp:Transcript_6950/g.18982  ORF Transcript_6950/g.18982 Transcript_6950/m.18982 type:complete len:212 (-) Transcript_6950:240-875(-)
MSFVGRARKAGKFLDQYGRSEHPGHDSLVGVSSSLNCRNSISTSLLPGKSGACKSISANTQPADHMSRGTPSVSPPSKMSGLRYHIDATRRVCESLNGVSWRANEKSQSLTTSSIEFRSRLDGLISRWAIQCLWQWERPFSICHANSFTRRRSRGPDSSMYRLRSRSKYSQTRNMRALPSRNALWMPTMFGCPLSILSEVTSRRQAAGTPK